MPKNLLVADDSITIQKVVNITFAGEDFAITAVDNGEDAIARARELQPDVILADVVMPRKNGYEVCEAVKSDPALKHIPVLLLTGSFEAFDEARARSAQADGHIAKPFESQALINRVRELVGLPAQAAPVGYASPRTGAARPAASPARPNGAAPAPQPAPAAAAADARRSAAWRDPFGLDGAPRAPASPVAPPPAPPEPAALAAAELEPLPSAPVAARPQPRPAPAPAPAERAASRERPVLPDGGEAQLREALSLASREVIERIAWEIVPQLAEAILREHIDRLVKDRH